MGNAQFGMLSVDDAWWGMQKVPAPEYRAKQRPKPLEITHDPMEGFPRGRKPRVSHVTWEEMRSAKLLESQRDYCAHKLIDFKTCRYKNYPLIYRCAHERHEYEGCQYDDYLIRLKEAERERRLRERDAARASATLAD